MKERLTDQIIMKGMAFHSHVGVHPEEKENGQSFELDVTFHCPRLRAVDTDILAQTIDYSQAYAVIRQIMEQASCDLIERLAGVIADALLQAFRLAGAVEVTVRKPEAPVDGPFDYMAVHIFRERS